MSSLRTKQRCIKRKVDEWIDDIEKHSSSRTHVPIALDTDIFEPSEEGNYKFSLFKFTAQRKTGKTSK